MPDLPTHARVAIVGGGIVGCSVAYHLAELGWTDVVLLERKKLTSGTTWHAAGLIGQLRATHNMTRLARYSAGLYKRLEAETGQATGFREIGSIAIATDRDRLEELQRGASMARRFGVAVEVISKSDVKRMWPLLHVDDILGGIFLPGDGVANPTDVTMALAKGARTSGARIFEDTKVTAVRVKDGRVAGVATARGEIACEVVVCCAGMWSREVGRMAGVHVPLHAAEHFYVVTEPMSGMTADLPVLREPSASAYFKQDAGKLLLGAFEPVAKPWGMDGVPEDFAFGQLPADVDHFQPILEQAMHRLPALAAAGIKTFFCGPESFTPDDRYLLGEAPEVRNFFVAAGFNSVGIQSAGGAGKVIAEWISSGHPPMDLWDVDIRRMLPFQSNARYLRERTVEGLGLLYAMHWPFRQFESARGVRKSPLHDRLAAEGACFGELAGWERPNWYAPKGVAPRYEYSYGRQNWFSHSAAEHRAVREAVGLFDQTSFGKFLVEGADAEAVLNRVCAGEVAVAPGRLVYTQWLNDRGGIEADLTVTRMEEDRYLIVTSAATQRRDFNWLRSHVPQGARAWLADATSAYATLGVMGPNSRALLQGLTDDDLANGAFPFGASREIDLAYARVRASRVTYVGEMGFEIYVPSEFALGVYEAIVAAGAAHGLAHAGYHAMNSLRIEKGYRHWGHDVTDEDTPLEAGLAFAVAWNKPVDFVGREALLRQREAGVGKRLVQFALRDPAPLLYHNEPIWRDGRLVGHVTSGMYGHTLGCAVGLGYVNGEVPLDAAFVERGAYEIEIAGRRFPARASLKPMYDPTAARVKA